jgi:hypothetical protein
MESRLALRLVFAAVVLAAFVACGGGGGGTLPGTDSGSANSGVTTAAKEQSVAGSALSMAGNSFDVDQFASTGGAALFAIRRAIATRDGELEPAQTATCQNGVEVSQSSSGPGSFQETIEFFYDAACTQPRKLIVLNVTFNSSGGTATGSETNYDTNDNVVDYKTDNVTFQFSANSKQLAEISVQRSIAASASAPPFASNGFSCIFVTANPIDCGNAIVATINDSALDPHIYATTSPTPSTSPSSSPTASPTPFEVGFSGTVVGTQVTPSPSSLPTAQPLSAWNPQGTQLQLSINGAGNIGPTGSMTIALAKPPNWSLTGGTQVTNLSGTATIGLGANGMFASNVNITLVDTADGLTVTLTSAGYGGLTGTVTNSSGQTVATVTVDANGDGQIAYTSGAVSQIRDWVILSS